MKHLNKYFILAFATVVLAVAAILLYGPENQHPANAAGQGAEGSGSKGIPGANPKGEVTVRTITPDGALSDPVTVPAVIRSEAEWEEALTPKQYYILREQGTEMAFSGKLLKNKEEGIYTCAGCALPLFETETKFESGTGWPSFYAPIAGENVAEVRDTSHGMVRTETVCARCGGHLGHVFKDGPEPTGLRYCMNSEALGFTPEDRIAELAETGQAAAKESAPVVATDGPWLPLPESDVPLAAEPGEARAIFAGGCFWCTEAVFEELDGVRAVISGYAGGTAEQANYQAVLTGKTGHAEAIEIIYDPSRITYGELMRVFFTTHDPTTLNRQGPDTGPQYRSAIFYQDEAEKKRAAAYIAQLEASGKFDDPIVTKLEPLEKFYEAEDYHQDYVKHNPNKPYVQYNALPKLEKLKKMLEADKKQAE